MHQDEDRWFKLLAQSVEPGELPPECVQKKLPRRLTKMRKAIIVVWAIAAFGFIVNIIRIDHVVPGPFTLSKVLLCFFLALCSFLSIMNSVNYYILYREKK